MESTNNNNNNNLMFVSEFKELRKELSAMKKRIDQLEKSHEKQRERIDVLVRENHALKTELSTNGNKEGESVLTRKRTDQEEEMESKSTSASASTGKKKTKTKTNNNNDDDEAVVVSRYYDDGDSFDSLSDDLLHKIVEFDGNCYNKFGSINKRCKNIYDVKEYKLEKETCVFGYGTVDMMLEYYLQKRNSSVRIHISEAVIWYNRLDAIDWIIQLGDIELLQWFCAIASKHGRINILSKMFIKLNLAALDQILNSGSLCYSAAYNGQLETLKWLRKYDAKWDASTFDIARFYERDEIVDYLRAEGCPEHIEYTDESSESEQVSSDDEEEDGDY